MPEKREHYEKDEKHWEEKHKKDPLSGVVGGLIVILLGVLFLLATMDYIDWSIWWAYLLMGIGGIFIIEVIIRTASPAYRRPITGKLIAGFVLIAIGAANIYGLEHWWPLIIIAVGIIIIFSALWRGKKPEEKP